MHLSNYRTSILLAITFVCLLSAFWILPNLACIIILSLLLQLLLNPLADWLSKKMPRSLAAGLLLLTFIALATSLLTIVSGTVLPTFREFITDLPHLTGKIQGMIPFEHFEFLRTELDDVWSNLMTAGVAALKSSFSVLLSIFNKFIDLIIILFVAFYLLADGEKIKAYLASLFPTADYPRVLGLFNRILSALRIYISSQLAICCITGLIVFLYFTLRGLPYASVFAVVSGIAEFIPVLGPTVASAFGTLLTATQSPLVALQTLGFYVILTQVNHNIVYPNLIGKSLNLHPIAIILGIILGGEVLGAAGMFLAVPVIVIAKIVIEDIYENRQQMKENMAQSRWFRKKQDNDS